MKLVRYILVMTISLIMFGCATFTKQDFRKNYTKLNKDNLTNLTGKYSFYPMLGYGKHCMTLALDSHTHVNSYQDIVNKKLTDMQCYDTVNGNNSCCIIKLKLINSNTLQLSLISNGTVISDTTFNGKLKHKMFFIDNKELNCHGIPYLFGGCYNSKRRIGLSNNNNLIINEAVCNEGAILLILGSGYRYNSGYEYKRIE